MQNVNRLIDMNNITDFIEYGSNKTNELEIPSMEESMGMGTVREPLNIVIPISVIYSIIFLTGVVGNISTCIVIAKNKSMHTATNYYLFSLAVSDLLLLVSGLPPEMYRIWWPQVYVFGEVFCKLQSFAAETSANATVLTITAFTVERYIAICHPFLTHTMSNLSRAVKFVMAIWITALCLAIPQAIPYAVYYHSVNGALESSCTITGKLMDHAFEISTLLFFVAPMTVISVLYVLIAMKLRHSRLLSAAARNEEAAPPRTSRNASAQNRVVKMLVAVVVAFFVCWAPFHAQRLLAVYISTIYNGQPSKTILTIYTILLHTSGVLYYLSTTINPMLYNIMSNKFREAFKTTLAQLCGGSRNHRSLHHRTYSTLSRCAPSIRHYQRSISESAPNGTQVTTGNGKNPNGEAVIQMNQVPLRKGFSRPRMNSESSQTTVLTSISRSIQNEKKQPRRHKSLNKIRSPSIGVFAQKFRTFSLFKEDAVQESLSKQKSSESATNTISNSSLQDMDETEFSSSDLVKFMGEVNQDLT